MFADCPQVMKDAALWHATKGRPVFPCYFRDAPGGKVKKVPLTPHGFLDASLDPIVISDWWSRWPEAGIGMPCGPASGLMVADYDVGAGYDVHEVREDFHQRFDLAQAPLVSSIRGGLHEYMRYAPDVGRSIHAIHPAVDILGDGGYVVLPPSRMPDGRSYRVLFDADPADPTEELLKAIRGAHRPPNGSANGSANGAEVLDFSDARAQHSVAALVRAAAEPSQWHRSARALTAHLIGRGCPPDVAVDMLTPLLTQPGYATADTRADLSVMVGGAVRKGWGPQTPPSIAKEKLTIELVSFAALQSRDPPEWQISGIMPAKSFGYVYGKSGTFKTFVTLDLALSIAFGRPWQNRAVKQGRAVYILGEGQGAFAHRVRCWQTSRGLGRENCEFWTIFRPIRFTDPRDVGALIDAIEAAGVHPDWVFVDTVQRNFGAGDPDKTQDMTIFVNAVDAVKARFDCGVFAVHHAGKDLTKGARNSSVLYASADFEMRAEREEHDPCVTLVCTKAKDWEEFGRIRLGTQSQTILDERTGEIVTSLAVMEAAPPPKEDAARGGVGLSKAQHTLLDLIRTGKNSLSLLATALKADRSNIRRGLMRLQERGLVQQDELGFWTIVVRENIAQYHGDEE